MSWFLPAETGLFDNGFRSYRPGEGRYNESDPLGLLASVNTYGYVGQNPLSRTDRLGLMDTGQDICEAEGICHPAHMGGSGGFITDAVRPAEKEPTEILNPPGQCDVASQQFSPAKQALVDMAKADKRTGMTEQDMQAYKDLNKGLPDPFPGKTVRGPESHPDSVSSSSQNPHGHVGPVSHIPIENNNE
jgi:RHS repeat-associated protein